jgi:NAD(P)H dehydrogenase (quinone)
LLRRADFDDHTALVDAFEGAQRLLLVSTGAENAGPRRVAQHRNALQAAHRAGVAHVVYTSLMDVGRSLLGPMTADHAATEEALRQGSGAHTILRNAFYMEMLLTTLPVTIATGRLRAIENSAGVAYVTRADGARAAAAALLGAGEQSRVFDITGPCAVRPAELVEMVNATLGTKISLLELPPQEFAASLEAAGIARPMAGLLAFIEKGLALGAMDGASGDFQELTGQEPSGVEDFLRQHKDQLLAHVRRE